MIPTVFISCCLYGVAPTMRPALRSCRLSPAIAAPQHTTAPIKIAEAGPAGLPFPRTASSKREEQRIVAIVTPEMGLFEEPTTPAIYAATAQNKKHAHNIRMAMTADTAGM